MPPGSLPGVSGEVTNLGTLPGSSDVTNLPPAGPHPTPPPNRISEGPIIRSHSGQTPAGTGSNRPLAAAGPLAPGQAFGSRYHIIRLLGIGGLDRFRIKIWDKATDVVIYDNRLGSLDDIDTANPQVIGGGSIVIHSGK